LYAENGLAQVCAAVNGVLPHPTRYLGADDEEKLSRDEAPQVRQLRAIASNQCEGNMEAGRQNVKKNRVLR
jgi:hypothetical protein